MIASQEIEVEHMRTSILIITEMMTGSVALAPTTARGEFFVDLARRRRHH